MAKLTDYSKWDNLEDSDEEEVADRVLFPPALSGSGIAAAAMRVHALQRADVCGCMLADGVPRKSDALFPA